MKRTSILAAIVVASCCAYWVGVASAGGAPTTTPLVYSGMLIDNAGAPVTTAHTIGLSLWDSATDTTAATHRKCIIAPSSITPNHGRFQIALDATCVAAVRATPDLWVEIFLDSGPLPRTHLGAAPYALEADHATSAALPAMYCGHTPNVLGDVRSWSAVRNLCSTACGASPTAHACSSDEIAASLQFGHPPDVLGRVTGQYFLNNGTGASLQNMANCLAWTSTLGSEHTLVVDPAGATFVSTCNQLTPFLCCN